MIWRTRRSASSFSKPNTSPAAPRCSAIGAPAIPGTLRCGRCTSSVSKAGRRGLSNGKRTAHASSAAAATPTRPAALDGSALSGTTGVVLDPVFSLRQRIRLVAGASVRLSFATGIASDRATAQALAQKYRDPSAASRTFALAFTNAQSGLRHLSISYDEAVLFERLASRVLFADGTLRASPGAIGANALGQAGLWPYSISGDLPILLVRVVSDDDVGLVRQVLQAQEYWRLKGLSADVVILNENAVELSGRDPGTAHGRSSTTDRGGSGSTDPGGAYLLRADVIGKADRALIEAAARAVVGGDRGDLRTQLDTPHKLHVVRRPAFAAGSDAGVDRSRRSPAPPISAAAGDARKRPRRLHGRGPRLHGSSWRAIRKRRSRGRTSSPTRGSAPS